MLRLLKLLIFGVWKIEPKHTHEWETVKEKEIRFYLNGKHSADDLPIEAHQIYYLRCKTCGVLRVQKFTEVPGMWGEE